MATVPALSAPSACAHGATIRQRRRAPQSQPEDPPPPPSLRPVARAAHPGQGQPTAVDLIPPGESVPGMRRRRQRQLMLPDQCELQLPQLLGQAAGGPARHPRPAALGRTATPTVVPLPALQTRLGAAPVAAVPVQPRTRRGQLWPPFSGALGHHPAAAPWPKLAGPREALGHRLGTSPGTQ